MTQHGDNPLEKAANGIVESEKSYREDVGRLALIGASVGLLAGGGFGFPYLGVCGFIIGAVAGLLISGLGLPLMDMLA